MPDDGKRRFSAGGSEIRYYLVEDAKDTWEEARQAAAFVRQKQLVLVTSASHMNRALKEFNDAGLTPLPAPTNYLAQKRSLRLGTNTRRKRSI